MDRFSAKVCGRCQHIEQRKYHPVGKLGTAGVQGQSQTWGEGNDFSQSETEFKVSDIQFIVSEHQHPVVFLQILFCKQFVIICQQIFCFLQIAFFTVVSGKIIKYLEKGDKAAVIIDLSFSKKGAAIVTVDFFRTDFVDIVDLQMKVMNQLIVLIFAGFQNLSGQWKSFPDFVCDRVFLVIFQSGE